MLFIESNSMDPYFNLATEEYLMTDLSRQESCFMLWQNDKTIVVGKNQNTAEEINEPYVREQGIRVARRLSGGGAVFHDIGNLNYTFVVDPAKVEDFSFRVFAQYVIDALESLGLKAEFTGRNDIVIDGKKISGVAQARRHGRVLHHGCILVNSDLSSVSSALKPKPVKFQSKSTKSVRSRVTTIDNCSEGEITVEVFKDALEQQLLAKGGMELYQLTEEDIGRIKQLRDEKYATWEWNYGKSPAYDFTAEKKFDFGLVTIHAQIRRGCIEAVRIYGDFFGDGEISVVEEALVGQQLDEGLEARMASRLDLQEYITGMTWDDLISMLR